MQRTATIVRLWGPHSRTPGRARFGGLPYAVLLGVAALLAVQLVAPARGLAQDAYRPLETSPTGGWIKHPRPPEGERATAGLDGHVGYVERDGYVSVQVNVDLLGRNIVGDAANEPSIAIDPTDPRKMAIGWRQFDSVESDFRQAGYGFSHDGGVTWTFPGSLTPGVFGSDPVLDSDADGNFYYLSFNLDELRLYKSRDSGVSWDNPSQVLSGFWDKPWMVVDRSESPGRGNIYVLADRQWFTRSTDGGKTFSSPIQLGTAGFPVLAIDRTGSVYASSGLDAFEVFRADNVYNKDEVPSFVRYSGHHMDLLFGSYAPNGSGLSGQVWIACHTPNGSESAHVYLLSGAEVDEGTKGESLQMIFGRSADRGETWSNYVRLNDDPAGSPDRFQIFRWFPMISVSQNGRIDAVWNDGRANPESTLTELYYTYSTDDGQTWAPNVPVSPVFDALTGRPNGDRKLGDYYHMRSDNLGVNVAYAATFNGEQDIWFLRIGPHDCNANEEPDAIDIRRNTSRDRNGNGIPDECELFGDFNGDSRLDLRDFQGMQLCFGAPSADLPGPRCTRLDLDLDGDVDHKDLRLLTNFLGP